MNALKKLDAVTDSIFGGIGKVCEILGIAGLLGIMILLAAQTVLKWFSVSLLWSDELVSFLNIWLVFTAASVVSKENKHVQVEFFTDMMPKKVQILLDTVITVLCIYACFHIFKGGLAFIRNTSNIKTNILRLPSVSLYLAPLLAVIFMGLMLLKKFVKLVFSLFMKEGKHA